MARRGGIARGIGIKVGNMVPACCECYPGGSIADLFHPEAQVFASKSRGQYGPKLRLEAWAGRCGLQPPRQREENE
jgi:hypothetical protein